MKLKHFVTSSLLLFSSVSFATTYKETLPNLFTPSRIAIQGAIATGGTLSIGIVNYSETTELGFTISGTYNNASQPTRTVTPVIFGGFRKSIRELTYFAYGLNLVGTFGRNNGDTIKADYQVGPYISLEQMLTTHLMLSGWILPYQYSYQKTAGNSSTSTNSFFNSGGIALNYLF